mmetsp:Transcript_10816/g.25705  ORF Transcript_10816/g.25705 Transcript_10816/m.25705 type:complete len:193 (+) Transcript_10816:239-817(+)
MTSYRFCTPVVAAKVFPSQLQGKTFDLLCCSTTRSRNSLQMRRPARLSCASSHWREVIDSLSGQPYYWDTRTNETSWIKPNEDFIPADETAVTGESASPAQGQRASPTSDRQSNEGSNTYDEILMELESTVVGSPNYFAVVANKHRGSGVFSNEFMDFLQSEIRESSDARKEVLEKVQARLVNPLLKQGEFY